MNDLKTVFSRKSSINEYILKNLRSDFRIIIEEFDNDFVGFPAFFIFKSEYIKLTKGIISYLKRQRLKVPRNIIQIIDSFLQNKKNTLLLLLDALVKYQPLKTVLACGELKKEVRFYLLKSIAINFEIFGLQKGKPVFKPHLSVVHSNNKKLNVHRSSKIYITDNLYIFDITAGCIFWLKKLSNLHVLKDTLLKSQSIMTLQELETIKSHLPLAAENKILIDLPPQQIKIKKYKPQPVLEMKELSGGVTLRLIFQYGEYDIPYHSESRIHVIEESGEEMTILQLKKKLHENTYLTLKKTLGKGIVRENRTPKGMDYHFSIACGSPGIWLADFGETILQQGIEIRRIGEKIKIKQGGKISFHVKHQLNWLEIKAGVIDAEGNFEEIHLDTESIDKLMIGSKDTYYLITKHEIEKLQNLILLGMSERGFLKLSAYNPYFIENYYNQIENRQDRDLQVLKDVTGKLKDFSKITRVPIPNSFHGKLREYQQAGLNWLFFLYQYNFNGCLADDMGLGKTIQVLVLLAKLKEMGKLAKALICVPVSILVNWENEICKFTPELSIMRHHGVNRKQNTSELNRYDIILVSYHTLRNDIDFFKDILFTYVILDEAQVIKNSASLISRSVKLLHTEHKLSLSGTPVENNTLELWSQFDFLLPGLLGSQKKFIDQFTKPIEEQGSTTQVALLRKIVFPFILRRKKEDVVMDLPEKEEIIFYMEMEDAQKKFYNCLKSTYRQKVMTGIDAQGIQRSAITIFEALLRLRQAALFPVMVSQEYQDIPSCKLEMLKCIIEDTVAGDHKILIFSQFVKCLSNIRFYLDTVGLSYAYLDGSTRDRAGEIRRFQEDLNIKIFLLSLKAGGIGINLTKADYVVLFDPWWNPAVEKQAVDRAYRIGQQNKVIAYKLIVKETVEEKILKLQEKKLQLINNLILEEKTLFKSLTREDITGLFE